MLKNRVLAGWIIAFAAGSGIALFTNGTIRIFLYVFSGVLGAFAILAHLFFIKKSKFDFRSLSVFSLLFFIGMVYTAAYTVIAFSGNDNFDKTTDTITAGVTDTAYFADGGYYDIKILESNAGLKKGTCIRLYSSDDITETRIRTGDIISCTVTYKKHSSQRLYAKNIVLTAQSTINDVQNGNGFFYNMRKRAEHETERLFAGFTSQVGNIANTLIVGEIPDMDPYVYELFRNAGLSHILVISGLHITLIILSLFSLLEFFTIGRKTRCIVCLVALLCYTFFVGFSPSVSRAAIMTTIMLLCMLFIRRADSITSLFAALLVLIFINPYNLFSLGLQLSFLSTLGILIVSPFLSKPIKGKARRTKKVLRAVFTPFVFSLVAAVFTFPSLLWSTKSVSFISPVTNLLIAPLYTYLVIMLIPVVLLFSVIGSWATVLSYIPGKIIWYSYIFLEWLYEKGTGSFSTAIPYVFIPLVFSIMIIILLCVLKQKRMKAAVLFLSVLFMGSIAFCVVNFNNQSRMESVTAYYDNGFYKSLFIADSGNTAYFDLGGKRSNIGSVYDHGFCNLDIYVVNGLDGSDYKKLKSALAQINIKKVFVPDPNVWEEPVYDQIKLLANSRKCDIIYYNRNNYNTVIEIGKSFISVAVESDTSFSDCFYVSVKRNGRSVGVYGDTRKQGVGEEYCDVVIMPKGYEEPYREVFCEIRCMDPYGITIPGSREGTEVLYDYSPKGYVRVTMQDDKKEVSLDEP